MAPTGAVACRPSEEASALDTWCTCSLILCYPWSADPAEASEHEGTSEDASNSDEEQADSPEEDSSAAYYSDGDGFPTFLSTASQVGEEGGSDAEVSLRSEEECQLAGVPKITTGSQAAEEGLTLACSDQCHFVNDVRTEGGVPGNSLLCISVTTRLSCRRQLLALRC